MRLATGSIWLAIIGAAVTAQTDTKALESGSQPTFGEAGLPRLAEVQTPSFAPSGGEEILRHRDVYGKPCLLVKGLARAHRFSPNLYDHVIAVVNSCHQRIVIRVCYYNSQDCIPMEISGEERKEAILGTLPSTKDFRFEFREKF
jgi:hypothetical protein